MPLLRGDIVLIIILLNAIRNDQIADLLKVINHAKYSLIILNEDSNTLKL